jgi:hypothetical protein
MGERSEREDAEDKKPEWVEAASLRLESATHAKAWPEEKACEATADDPCKDSKDVIAGSFAFMQGYAIAELDKLAADLKKVDKPNWQEALLEQFFDIALLTGGALAGEYIVEHLGKAIAEEGKVVAQFIKKSLEEGAPKGVKAALQKLGGETNPDIDEFITAQKMGVTAMYQNAATTFLEKGRYQLANTREATALKESLSPVHLMGAAKKQYFASLDAYLCCLAKQTLGTTKAGTTNMTPQSERAPDAAGHAPDLDTAMIGLDKGVLTAMVLAYDDVTRAPGVWDSCLHGVNEAILEKYENVPLSMVRIPRQLICSVRGDMSDFTVNIDEAGAMHLAQGDGDWLEARGRSLRPDVSRQTKPEQRRIGVDLLLADLKIEKIGGGPFL